VTDEIRKLAAQLPENFDWRNISGQNFVSPVRDQGSCGSCYSFSATAMIEARLRVMSNNSQQVVLSPQDVVSCSEYSQGIDNEYLLLNLLLSYLTILKEHLFFFQVVKMIIKILAQLLTDYVIFY